MQDTATARRSVGKYTSQNAAFGSTPESALVLGVIEALEVEEMELFTEAVIKFYSVKRLDNWTTDMLLRIKGSCWSEGCGMI